VTDYTWRPRGLPIRTQGIAIDPYLAFKLFVLPGLVDPGWIEDSRDVTDTNMSMREWAGLIIHAITLMDKTGDTLRVAKTFDNDDGGLVRGENEVVYVEQTLATHRNPKHSTLLEVIEERVEDKSSNGESYAANQHLIVFCNMDGELQEDEIAKIVSKGRFNIVNVFGFDGKDRHYLALLFDKDVSGEPIHKCAISEAGLIEAARSLPEKFE
jgi:hypothetical protein